MKTTNAVALVVLLAPPILADPIDDPWAMVPDLPTACYADTDDFQERANNATQALGTEYQRQEAINRAISEQSAELDPMEMQQRMVTYLMEHPEDAQRYMESLQQIGQEANEQAPQNAERYYQFDADMETLSASYDSALRDAMAPLQRRGQRLDETSGHCNEKWLADARALVSDENATYERLCATWWNKGPFHAWLGEFRQFQIEIAARQDEQDNTAKQNYEVMGIATDGYRPTGYLRAPIEYLRRAGPVFAKRRVSPVPISQDMQCNSHG